MTATRAKRPAPRVRLPREVVEIVERDIGRQMGRRDRAFLEDVWRRAGIALDVLKQRPKSLAALRHKGVTKQAAAHLHDELGAIDSLVLEVLPKTPLQSRAALGTAYKRIAELSLWVDAHVIPSPGRLVGTASTAAAWMVEELSNTRDFPFNQVDRPFVLQDRKSAVRIALIRAQEKNLSEKAMPTPRSIKDACMRIEARRREAMKLPGE